MLDENEGEPFHASLCWVEDALGSAGRDGIWEWGEGDDIVHYLPRRKSTPDC